MSIQSTPPVAASAMAQAPATGNGNVQSGKAEILAGNGGKMVEGAGAAQGPLSAQQLGAVLEEVQAAIRPVASELNFSLDEESGRMMVRIVDRQTDEVIRQIPSEELLRISKALDKLQGLLLNKEA
jgi:flagellar protein FlaG